MNSRVSGRNPVPNGPAGLCGPCRRSLLPEGRRLQVPQEVAGHGPSLVSVGRCPDCGDSPPEHGGARWHVAHQPFWEGGRHGGGSYRATTDWQGEALGPPCACLIGSDQYLARESEPLPGLHGECSYRGSSGGRLAEVPLQRLRGRCGCSLPSGVGGWERLT